MAKSILTDVAEYLGFNDEYAPFAKDICALINTELANLVQLGVIARADAIEITDDTTVWSDVLFDEAYLSMAKQYVRIGVKLAFDPPTSAALLDALTSTKDECGWRAKIAVEEKDTP